MAQSIGTPAMWLSFFAGVLALLGIDMGVLGRGPPERRMRQAAIFTAVVLLLAGSFAALLAVQHGSEAALQFVTGFVVEEALSVDNLFVFLLIFAHFGVTQAQQHPVLFWGIFGALAMRAAFIAVGTALVAKFHWIFYIFGAFLLFTGIKLVVQRDDGHDPAAGFLVRLYRRVVPSTEGMRGNRFFVRENGRLLATPLLLVLCVVEVTDIVFAVDSIPAIFSVTTDPFLVYTSNVFAILGLRSLYFLLAGMMDRFVYLKYGLGLVLCSVGGKMLVEDFYHVSTVVSLGTIASILGTAVVASLLFGPPRADHAGSSGPRP